MPSCLVGLIAIIFIVLNNFRTWCFSIKGWVFILQNLIEFTELYRYTTPFGSKRRGLGGSNLIFSTVLWFFFSALLKCSKIVIFDNWGTRIKLQWRKFNTSRRSPPLLKVVNYVLVFLCKLHAVIFTTICFLVTISFGNDTIYWLLLILEQYSLDAGHFSIR